jgi:hypothetical protein
MRFLQLLIDRLHALNNGFGRFPLEIGIERSIYTQSFVAEFAFSKPGFQLIFHEIGEVWRFPGIDAIPGEA